LLEKAAKEGPSRPGATIPYAYPKLSSVFQHLSFCCVSPANRPLAITEGPGAAGQPQSTLPITIPSQSYPPQGHCKSLLSQPDLTSPTIPSYPIMDLRRWKMARCSFTFFGRRMSMRIGRGTRSCARLLRTRSNKVLNTLAEKKAARQNVVTRNHPLFWFRVY
jgi:hypothetical protein